MEGFFDALTADLSGIPGVVSTMYQELSLSHLYKLKACGAEEVCVILRREQDRTGIPHPEILEDGRRPGTQIQVHHFA